jgi:transaldolase
MVDRPNVMIKVPATIEGLTAIRQLTSEGVNVNVTLLFGLPRYRAVAEAYLAGLEDRIAANLEVESITSVASFFLSRIDVLLDPLLEKKVREGGRIAEIASTLVGNVAVSSAKEAYRIYREIKESDRFRKLSDRGCRPQWVLWASTGTKNPAYSDVKYVEPLIGPETINTMPVETLKAYRDHGRPELRLEENVEEAQAVLKRLPDAGISLDAATQRLEDEGVEKFVKPFDKLIRALEEKITKAKASAR